MRFDAFMESALYGPNGFYATGHGAGTSRDFLTSPEVGSLFGAVVAARIDAEWQRAGRPTRFTFVEMGAGPGTLARTVFAAGPECLPALHYVLVDIAPGMRALHADHLPPERVHSVESLSDLPSGLLHGMVFANELLDNIPCRVLRYDGLAQSWFDVCVDRTSNGELTEHAVPADPLAVSIASGLLPDPPDGCEIPLQSAAAALLSDMMNVVSSGSVVVIDYARLSTQDFAKLQRSDWMRTYDRHNRGHNPLVSPGTADITVDVALDQLIQAVGEPTACRPQRQALTAWGLDTVLERSARTWTQRPSDYDLGALRARSHVSEADVLTDEQGLGGFTVLEWIS